MEILEILLILFIFYYSLVAFKHKKFDLSFGGLFDEKSKPSNIREDFIIPTNVATNVAINTTTSRTPHRTTNGATNGVIEGGIDIIDDIDMGSLMDIFKNKPYVQQNVYSDALALNGHLSTLPKIYFNIEIKSLNIIGKIVIELYMNVCPKTCENFRALCSGEYGYTKNGQKLSYKNSIFHRIIPGFMCQSGDILSGTGHDSISIYGESFDDENFLLKHDKRGMVSMANHGPDTNGSQFFILFDKQQHLNGKHTVFGSMVSGYEILEKIEQCGSDDGTPTNTIKIIDCGTSNI